MNSAPIIVLSHPQIGENIGAAARAMANFGLSELRMAAPRDGWPNEKATAMAVGASYILDDAKVYPTLKEALGDIQFVFATTARERGFAKPIYTPDTAAGYLRDAIARGEKTAILFGNERTGLENDEVSFANAVITIPTNPDFSSINLGQAVLLAAYEWFKSGDETPAMRLEHGALATPATREEIFQLFDHLEGELLTNGFLYPPDKADAMIRNIRAMLTRADFTHQEVRTLRGIIVALADGKHRRRGTPSK
ncbi:MAG TPA: RNA methyltransferase [Rhizomicrobium sp.]|nr:RNA methyltransferase [Rhizomicrobium sp.]